MSDLEKTLQRVVPLATQLRLRLRFGRILMRCRLRTKLTRRIVRNARGWRINADMMGIRLRFARWL